MKRLLYLSVVLVSFGIYSCDKITNPIINKGNSVSTPITPPTHVDSTTFSDDALLKVLVEDYTAHHCTNCPAATKQCEDLLASLPANNLPQCIFMECDVATLAKSYGSWPTFCWNDYINLADSNWNNTFIDGDNQMPGTMVDRIYYTGHAGGKNDLYGTYNVATIFDSLVGISPAAAMNQTVNMHIVDSMYAPPTSTLAMDITTKLLAPNANNKYYMVVGLVEDSIYDDQDSLGNLISYYLKRMTLRTVVNANGSGWGDTLSHTTSPQTMHYTYANIPKFTYTSHVAFPPPSKSQAMWNMAHMYIVAFVYQTGSVNNYMVLQAQRLHL
jgi:hypothetical protein